MDALKRKSAERRIENFKQHAGLHCFNLACHAAVPMAFTPDLLYCLWSNFRLNRDDWPDWVGVAEVMLSSLCKETSYELFEMDTVVQELLRQELEQLWGRDRVLEVARFVFEYVAHEQERTLEWDLAEAQRWVALAYLDPDRVVVEVSHALQQNNEANHWRILNLQSVFPPDLRPRLEKLIQESRPSRVEPEHVRIEVEPPKPPIVPPDKNQWSIITSFVTGGTLSPDNPTYIHRSVSKDLLTLCLQGQFAYVLACRHMGKSSMVVGVRQQLIADEVDAVFIDLTEIGELNNPDEWYINILSLVIDETKINVDLSAWWEEHSHLSANRRFNQCLEEQILPLINKSLVIFLDEIDTLLGSKFTDNFMANIRVLYNQRASKPIFQKLTFVLIGVTTPDELINDPLKIPFNIGKRIDLEDFTKQELVNYQKTLQEKHPQYGNQYFEDIFTWVNGHPYLTQKLCGLVFGTPTSSNKTLVDELVQKNFINQLTENNIAFVQSSLTSHPLAIDMLTIYLQVASGEMVANDVKSPAMNRLKLTGIVVAHNGILQVRNKLYAAIFDKDWAEKWSEQAKANLMNFGLPGHYDIVQTMSQHGAVTVYRAQNRLTNKMVALKVLDIKITQPEQQKQVIERFKAEIEAFRHLQHPHIVEIYEVSESNVSRIDEQKLYLEMQFVTGGTLADFVPPEMPWKRPSILRLLKEVGEALAYMHQNGYVHLDIKPHNILLEPQDDGSFKAMLTDFGIATLINTPNDRQGTLKYAAPEQHEANQSITPAADIYALGLIAYELLAGKYSPTPLPLFTDERYVIFNEILAKATHDDPTKRYQDVMQFVEALISPFVGQELQRALLERDYPDTALQILQPVLYVAPNEPEALKLKSQMLNSKGQRQEAIETLTPAFEQTKDITSKLGQEYVFLLNNIAGDLWQQQKYREALSHYEQINHLFALVSSHKSLPKELEIIKGFIVERQRDYYFQGLDETPTDEFNIKLKSLDERVVKLTELQAIDKVAELVEAKRLLQVNYYYSLGVEVYEQSQSKNLDGVIWELKNRVEQVKSYQGEAEAIDLQAKLHDLQNKRNYQLGLEALQANNPQEALERVNKILKTLDDHDPELARDLRLNMVATVEKTIHTYPSNYQDEAIFNYYRELDLLYEKLGQTDKRKAKAQANVKLRRERAQMAEAAKDYGVAVKHLTHLQQSPIYKTWGKEVGFTPDELEAEIKRIQNSSWIVERLAEVDALTDRGEYQLALSLLNQSFISQNIYTAYNRDLLELAKNLRYATEHGHLPVADDPTEKQPGLMSRLLKRFNLT